jgi:hypothetical protein
MTTKTTERKPRPERPAEVRECRVCGDQYKLYAHSKRTGDALHTCERCRVEAHFGIGLRLEWTR